MKKDHVRISDVRESLRRQQFAGLSLPSETTVSQIYGTVASMGEDEKLHSTAGDWACVSYVHTSSAVASGGMPVWVAEDVEQVLDGLVDAKIINERAIWFDRIGMKQHERWPALSTLHCLAAPVICVPPTRTVEYSRYQIPDRWDSATFDFFTKIENLLRFCAMCGSKCPLEFDSRLINIAAALRAWPTNEAAIGSASRGAFVSFATMDRLQYTIAWYQVLLQIGLDLVGYGPELIAKSVELYGEALFQPCSRCLSVARQLVQEENATVNCQLLDDALVALVMQVNRFTLPAAADKECLDVWSLEGLYKSPGEAFNLGKSNPQRLKDLTRKVLVQRKFEEIAANICRGRPSLASCYREGDKWLCALILSNLHEYVGSFRCAAASFSERNKATTLRLLQLNRPFGELCYKDSTLEVEGNRCIRSPPCSGKPGSVCLFNELSGVMPPTAVGEFFADYGFTKLEIERILSSLEASLRRRLHSKGIALLCYEFRNGAVRDYGTESCGACYRDNPKHDISRHKLILLGWRAQEDSERTEIDSPRDHHKDEIVYSFITLRSDEASHVKSRGIFCRSNPQSCRTCKASFVRVEVEGSVDLLEIHVNRLLPIATTLDSVYDTLSKGHET